MKTAQRAGALSDGDVVAVVSPASWPSEAGIDSCLSIIRSWGFEPRLATHARDQLGYLAGRDEDRLADLNDAIRDPDVRAIVTTRGGCGSSRLLHGVDIGALIADPVPLVGYSDITALHRVWHAAGVASLHGAAAGRHADVVGEVLRGRSPEPVRTDPGQYGAALTTGGRAEGLLFGGNLEMLARSVGVLPFDLSGHVLLLEINRAAGLGMVDRALTQLMMSGSLDGIVGVALGWLCDFEHYVDRGWSILDVLAERLGTLGVPILAGLTFGHDPDPLLAPLRVPCVLDADAGTLTMSAALAWTGRRAHRRPPGRRGSRPSTRGAGR